MGNLDGRYGRIHDSCTIITTECNALMQPIHNRMPVILSPENWGAWLDPDLKQEELLLSVLKPFDVRANASLGCIPGSGEDSESGRGVDSAFNSWLYRPI
jgi:putative SOS response-associated peptidase YedK